MSDELRSKKVAILVTDGFEQVELTEPKRALTRPAQNSSWPAVRTHHGLSHEGLGRRVSRRYVTRQCAAGRVRCVAAARRRDESR